MAYVRSNFLEVRAAFKRAAHILDLNRSGSGGRQLGDVIADTVASGIRRRVLISQTDPTNARLAPLKPATLARKSRLGFPSTIGVETGEMLELQQLRGVIEITPDVLDMTYGTTDDARQKLEWFQEGSSGRPREIYGIDPETEAAIDAEFEKVLAAGIRELGG